MAVTFNSPGSVCSKMLSLKLLPLRELVCEVHGPIVTPKGSASICGIKDKGTQEETFDGDFARGKFGAMIFWNQSYKWTQTLTSLPHRASTIFISFVAVT